MKMRSEFFEGTVIVIIAFALLALVVAAGRSCAQSRHGEERNPCYGNKTCNGGLICKSDLCVKP